MKYLFLVLGALLAASCTSEPDKLQRQYEMMERAGGSEDELCAQAHKIEQAYLEADDEARYKEQKMIARHICLNAELSHRLGR